MCNPLGASTNHIVAWSAIERCRYDYEIERLHLESDEILQRFGEFNPSSQSARESQIESFLKDQFPNLLSSSSSSSSSSNSPHASSSPLHHSSTPPLRSPQLRLGFDVAASGQGDLAVIYIDEAKGDDLSLRALFTCRTEDWHFLKTVLFAFLRELRSVQAVGDETGLGKQICWEARYHFGGRFQAVNFSSKKHDIGFPLM